MYVSSQSLKLSVVGRKHSAKADESIVPLSMQENVSAWKVDGETECHSIYIIYSFIAPTKYLPTCLLVAQSIFHREFSSCRRFHTLSAILNNQYPQPIFAILNPSSIHRSTKKCGGKKNASKYATSRLVLFTLESTATISHMILHSHLPYSKITTRVLAE